MKNMFKITKGLILILLTGLLLASCTAGAPATPTSDPNALFTQVAQTVMVSINQTAAALPTKTPVPTNTAVSTPIPFPTQDIYAIPPTQPVIPGYPTPTVQRFGDVGLWYGQSPADGLTYAPFQKVSFHGCMRNIGDRIWNTGYYLAFAGGPNLWGGTTRWSMGSAVLPGGVWCWDFIPGTMPENKGSYTTWFWFYSDHNIYISDVYFKYTVIG
jgi:hypothetical protein